MSILDQAECLLEAEHGFFQTGPETAVDVNVGNLRIEDGDGAQVILKQLDLWSLAAFLQHRARPFAAVKVLDASDRLQLGELAHGGVDIADLIPGSFSHSAVHREVELLLDAARGPPGRLSQATARPDKKR